MNPKSIAATLSIAWKDVKMLLNDRGTLIYLFVIPMVFILAFSGTMAGGSEEKEKVIALPVVNLDIGGEASQTLIEALDRTGAVRCELVEQGEVDALLDKGDIKRVLTIPTSFTSDLSAGLPVRLRLVSDPDASEVTNEAVQRVVEGVSADLSLETQLIASFRQMADMQAALPPEQQVFSAGMIVDQAQSQFARARTQPLLGLEETWPEHLASQEKDINPVNLLVPGFAILFIFLTAQATAQSIYEEKKTGSFRRLLAAPISKVMILTGKMVPNFVTVLIQIVVIFGVSMFLLPLLGLDRMTLGNDPLALVLLCLVIALCSTSLGVLIAAIARTEGQIGGLSQVVLWALGFAGIILPQIPLGPPLENIAQLIPHFWANEAFYDLFIRGQGLSEMGLGILALLGFTAVFFVVGLWRFEFR
jgi:ABC-2 type transport system permease protein